MESFRIISLLWFLFGLAAGQVSLLPSVGMLEKPIGATATVFCNYIGSGTAQPTWRNPNGDTINPSGSSGTIEDIIVTYPTSTETKLEISNIEKADEGTYTCSAGSGGSKSISIHTYTSAQIVFSPSPQLFEIYTVAQVLCEVTADPLPSYEWKFGTISISQGDKYTIEPRQYLQINNITSADAGTYHCSASERGGQFDTVTAAIDVTVLVPPKITLAPLDRNGTEGGEVEFSCIATGKPEPIMYSWEVNNSPINSGGRFLITNNGEKLTISNLVKNDVGSYKCIASIDGLPEEKNAERSAFLNVFTPPSVAQGIEQIAEVNEAVTFRCNTVRGDDSELVWQRFGEDMPLGSQPNAADVVVEYSTDGAVLELKFVSVKRLYNGSYTCLAKNAGGEASSVNNLTVHFAPVIDTERTQRDSYKSWIGNSVTLICYWFSNPAASFYWKIGGINLTEPTYVTSLSVDGGSTLEFTPAKIGDFATYKCLAWNIISGSNTPSEHLVELSTASASDPPDVRVVSQAPTTITLDITKPTYTGGLELLGYNITWKFERTGMDVAEYRIYNYNEDSTLYIIDSLTSTKEYKIGVASVNEFGFGHPSAEQTVRTLATREPYPPPITSPSRSDEKETYQVTWEDPESSGLDITNFYLQYWKFDPEFPNTHIPDEDKSNPRPFEIDVHSFTITELKEATNYKLELWATNALGEGDHSKTEFVTAGEKKLPPTEKSSGQTEYGLSKEIIIVIVILAFVVVLIVVDISCCIVNACGLTMCLCVHCCGRHAPGSKAHEIEMGDELADDGFDDFNGP